MKKTKFEKFFSIYSLLKEYYSIIYHVKLSICVKCFHLYVVYNNVKKY